MALPTFQELLAAYQGNGGPAAGFKAGTEGVQSGMSLTNDLKKRQMDAKTAEAEIALKKSQATYYGKRDPLEEITARGGLAEELLRRRLEGQAAALATTEAGKDRRTTQTETGKTARTNTVVGAKQDAEAVAAAGKVAGMKPTKESFLSKVAAFGSGVLTHPIDTYHNLSAPAAPTPQAQAQTFLQSKFQKPGAPAQAASPAVATPAVSQADPDASAKEFLKAKHPELTNPTPEDIAWAKGKLAQ